MILGIKVGPQKQSFLDLQETQASFVEVWFNIEKKQDYADLFTELHKRHIMTGLHFWGHLADKTWTNIAHTNQEVVNLSMAQIQETIDIAAQHQCVYVNIHPSNRALIHIDFDHESFQVLTEPIPYAVAEEIFFTNLETLHTYAKERNVLLTIETIPSRDAIGWHGTEARKNPIDLYALENTTVVKAATRGFTIANDFGHTGCTIHTDNRHRVWDFLFQTTQTLAQQTRLLHLGYLVPPYNGTDFHSHLDNPIFDTPHAVPNRQEMIELLRLFTNRQDVWALVEPDGQHVKNYFLAQNILKEAGF